MKIGFFPNLTKKNIREVLLESATICQSLGIDVYLPEWIDDDVQHWLSLPSNKLFSKDSISTTIDMAFSFGGDGTIINLAKELHPYHIPICGVNLGELGFLNQIELHNIDSRLRRIAEGNYFLEDRSLLTSYIEGPRGRVDLTLAMNDVVITRVEPGRMARINLAINGSLTEQYPADGLVISTATGSTGYNLSTGGPIMAPDNHSVIVSPICPHIMQSVSLVLREDANIVITMPQREKSLYISVDGTNGYEMLNDESLHISSHPIYSPFVRFHNQRFFGTLFKKLSARRDMLV